MEIATVLDRIQIDASAEINRTGNYRLVQNVIRRIWPS